MKSTKGTCPVCGKSRWLGGKGRICKPCGYAIGVCSACSHRGKIYVGGLCYCCYQHRRVDRQLARVQEQFQPKSDYNRYSFDLFLRYIRRYRLAYFHARQARELADLLEQVALKPIRGWNDILELTHLHRLFHRNKKDNGCAFLKIGYMLQELGVIGLRRDEREYWIDRIIEGLDSSVREDVISYINRLRRLGAADSTLENHLRYLRDFFRWFAATYPQLKVAALNEPKIIEYSQILRARSDKVKFLRDNILGLRRYFAWLVYQRKIAENPCARLNPPEAEKKIVICSNEQLQRLMAYISEGASPPEGAFLLSLILFYGFTTQELQKATLTCDHQRLLIVFDRPRRTYGRHFYNRDESLILPSAPKWFADLQGRFYRLWLGRYEATKKTFPCRRLVLPKHGHHTRPICEKTLLERIYVATCAATGVCITPKVLRQTCGNIYSRGGDGSLLSRLGWSREFAFHYTWLPRKIDSGGPWPKYIRKPRPEISSK